MLFKPPGLWYFVVTLAEKHIRRLEPHPSHTVLSPPYKVALPYSMVLRGPPTPFIIQYTGKPVGLNLL